MREIPTGQRYERKGFYFMKVNFQRTLVDTNGKVSTFTEQQYIRKYSTDYYHNVQNSKLMEQFKQDTLKDVKKIMKCLKQHDVVTAKKLINDSAIFGFNLKSSKFVMDLMQDFKKPTDKNLDEKKSKVYNALKISIVHLQNSNPRHDGLHGLSRKCLLGMGTLSDNKRDTIQELKWELNFWKSVVCRTFQNGSERPETKNDPNAIRSLNAVLSFDTEWQTQPDSSKDSNKMGVKIRRLEDVLNISYAIWFPDYPSLPTIKGVILNTPDKEGKLHAFNFRNFFATMIDRIQVEFHAPNKYLKLAKINWLVTGYFMGVDWSVLSGWNKLQSMITVINKQYIFTSQPFKINVRSQAAFRKMQRLKKANKPLTDDCYGIDNIITVRDAGLLAPQGGLKALGNIVNIHKLDTEQDDIKHGKPLGFYKTHMTEYLKDCPKRYLDYVMTDALIPLEYLKVVMATYNLSWTPFNSIPMTTSNYAMTGVYNSLITDAINQRIFRGDVKFSDIKDNPPAYVRDGYRDTYVMAQNAYFGGFNVAFGSFVVFGVVVDTDLSSAYNTAGNLMPYPDYTVSSSHDLADIGTKLVNIADVPFEKVYQALKSKLEGFPFVLGVGRADVTYPSSYHGITMTPSRKQDGSPVYVRQIKDQYLPLIDLIDAYEHGATVTIHSLYVPAQRYDHRTAWADQQHRFLVLRQDAKKTRDSKPKGSEAYKKYDATQLLFKLAGNTIYGKSAQSVRPKRSHNFMTDEIEDVNISKITDPLIASTYTAFTRYLAHVLYDSVGEFYGDDVLPANITTDGYSFVLPVGTKFDFDGVNAVFNSKLPEYYQQRLQELNYKAGFERKGNKDDFDKPSWVFNLRTRLNGTLNIDCLEALGGIQANTYTIADIFNALDAGKVTLPVKGVKISNLTEMKFGARNHMQGVMYDEPRYTRIPLQYDCAYKPYKWLPRRWKGYGFVCVPFDTMDERETWKKHSKILTDRYNIMRTQSRFETYLYTMMNYSFYHSSELDNAGYQDKALAIYHRLINPKYSVDREYKDTAYRCFKNVSNGKKIGVCMMSIYDNVSV